jgi:glycosyltransferase involved in cell wall biosynthesis
VRRLVFVVTIPVTANVLLRGQLSYLREAGYDITVVSSPGPDLDEVARREGVRVLGVPMQREISPAADAVSLARLTRELRRLRPHIVNASTAKAGLLGMLAAKALRVPARVYMLRGLRLETVRGARRAILAATERVAAGCAHRVWCVSNSLRATYLANGFASARKCTVVGRGSSNGVEFLRFARTSEREAEAGRLRTNLGIPSTTPVIGFVGRPVVDKGVRELRVALELVRKTLPAARLDVVGAGFAGDRVEGTLIREEGVVLVPPVPDLAPYYAMMDVLAFPSYREGFPNVPLEAAIAGVPTVGFHATGTVDAVVDGTTGILVRVGDVQALARALLVYLLDPKRRCVDGNAARRRAVRDFASERVWEDWRRAYALL